MVGPNPTRNDLLLEKNERKSGEKSFLECVYISHFYLVTEVTMDASPPDLQLQLCDFSSSPGPDIELCNQHEHQRVTAPDGELVGFLQLC